MAKRYTIKELEGMTDIQLAISVLNERLNDLTNYYSPLASRLRRAIGTLEGLQREERKRNDAARSE